MAEDVDVVADHLMPTYKHLCVCVCVRVCVCVCYNNNSSSVMLKLSYKDQEGNMGHPVYLY